MKWGTWGAILFEGDEAAYAARTSDAHDVSIDDTFERQLREAKAFGRACNGLADKHPELSARSGLSAGQRFGGAALFGGLATVLVLAPAMLALLVVLFFAGFFSIIILMRLCATLSALLRKPAA
ncbi:MAG TPA: hypothetical protein VFV70_13335, partial [Hyphomonadaceae bacterium]|nr:hypothetical protein [Hyphomonadaceae bacterium]